MFNLLPKDEKFYDELEQLSTLVVDSAKNLEAIIDQFPKLDGQLDAIERGRVGAGKVYSESLLRLDQAFITPIDREDILSLITEMYGVVDRVAELSQRFRLYRIDKLYPTLDGQARNLSAVAKELDEIIHGLRKKEKLKDMKGKIDAVTATMELVKRDREKFLATLFNEDAQPLDVLKKRELHELLEEAIERCEEATETMVRVLLKNS
jgi:uncharacterized protein